MKFYRGIDGHMGDAHRIDLQTAVLATSHVPGSLLEVGSYKGLSAIMTLAVMASGKKLTMVEVQEQPELRANLTRYGVLDLVELHFGGFEKFAAENTSEMFSHVFIDHDHSYATNVRCIELFWPRVMPGGILTFHDYGHEQFPGVKQAVDEFRESLKPKVFKAAWTYSFIK